jgi:hypothetical protein
MTAVLATFFVSAPLFSIATSLERLAEDPDE